MLQRHFRRPLRLIGNRWTSSESALRGQLSIFPEYSLAQEEMSKGQFSKALPALQRVHEVMTSTMGPESELVGLVTKEMATTLQLLGKYPEARATLEAYQTHVQGDDNKVRLLCHITRNSILQGDFDSAERSADEAVALCEKEVGGRGTPAVSLDLMGASYQMRGLKALQCAEWDDAEEHLQLAARWSQHSAFAQLVALHNLGLYQWCSATGPHVEPRSSILKQGKLWKKEKVELNEERTEAAQEALGCFDEALEVALGPDESSGSAAALCGPMGTTSGMLGPGSEENVRVINPSTAPKVIKTSAGSDDDLLIQRLQDPSFATAYATTLCSAAGVCAALEKAERAAELRSSALQSLDAHKEDPMVQPVLGWVLGLMAFESMASSQAVTAEGLFRAADDYLQGPYAQFNPRWQYERAYVQGGYAVLLSKWDKRAGDSDRAHASSRELFAEFKAWRHDSPVLPHFIFPSV